MFHAVSESGRTKCNWLWDEVFCLVPVTAVWRPFVCMHGTANFSIYSGMTVRWQEQAQTTGGLSTRIHSQIRPLIEPAMWTVSRAVATMVPASLYILSCAAIFASGFQLDYYIRPSLWRHKWQSSWLLFRLCCILHSGYIHWLRIIIALAWWASEPILWLILFDWCLDIIAIRSAIINLPHTGRYGQTE